MVIAAYQTKGRIPIIEPEKIDALEGIIADHKKRLLITRTGYSAVYEEGLAILAADFDPEKRLSKAAARYLYKMMAIKDEYEVAPLVMVSSASK